MYINFTSQVGMGKWGGLIFCLKQTLREDPFLKYFQPTIYDSFEEGPGQGALFADGMLERVESLH